MNYQQKYLKYKTKYLALKFQLCGNNCNVCGIEAKNFCARCKKAYYCSPEHQKSDWSTHKQVCTKPTAVAESVPTRRRVDVVLLAEEHGQPKCLVRNIGIIHGLVVPNGEPKHRRTFFVVSEGRELNDCYAAMGLPEELAIIEHREDVQTNTEMMDKLLLLAEIIKAVSDSSDPILAPDGTPINISFLRDRRDNDGFLKLLRETRAENLYEELLACTFEAARKRDWMNTMMRLLQQFMLTLPDNAENNNLRGLIQPLLRDGSFRHLETVFRSFRESRDTNIIQRIVTRVNGNPDVDLVIIIFGQVHFDNLRRLIESNVLFRFSDRSDGSI